jgi:DNA-3-methyladenine glycosylase
VTRFSKISNQTPLPRSFYQQSTLSVASALLGKYLYRKWRNSYIVGKIVETEAYIGEDDPACHAARGKTRRNAIMYGPPGFTYIYFIYGMYFCLNVVTESEGFPAAVLIRAVEPIDGIEQMKKFRKIEDVQNLSNGPGKLCQAFHLDRKQNGMDLCGMELFITHGEEIAGTSVVRSKRVGIKVGVDHLWRFFIKNNSYVSKGGKT